MIYTGLDGERHKINIDRNAEFYMIDFVVDMVRLWYVEPNIHYLIISNNPNLEHIQQLRKGIDILIIKNNPKLSHTHIPAAVYNYFELSNNPELDQQYIYDFTSENYYYNKYKPVIVIDTVKKLLSIENEEISDCDFISDVDEYTEHIESKNIIDITKKMEDPYTRRLRNPVYSSFYLMPTDPITKYIEVEDIDSEIEYLPNNTKFRRKTLKHKYSRNKTLKHIVLRRFPKINMRIEYFVTSYGMPVSYPVYEKSYT